jgi:hypothetical protein
MASLRSVFSANLDELASDVERPHDWLPESLAEAAPIIAGLKADKRQYALALGIMEDEAKNDVTAKEAAIARNIDPATARKLKERAVAEARRRWSVYAGIAAVACIVLFLLFRGDGKDDIVTSPYKPPRTAEKLREQGLYRCSKQFYRLCLEELDEAKKLDPEGDKAPEIVKARAEAKAAMGEGDAAAP